MTVPSVAVLLLVLLALPAALALWTAVVARRIEAALPPHGSFVDLPGGRLHSIDRGQGPVLLLIHGLGGQAGNFTHSLVERLTEDFRVVVVERPGSGHSTRAAGASAALGAQAQVIADFIAVLGLGAPVVVGHSLGGAVALALALNHPRCVCALALIAPLTQVEGDVPGVFKGLAIRSPRLRRLIAWTLVIPIALRTRERVLAQVFGPDAMPADFPARGGGLLGLRPASFIAASADLAAVNDDLPGLVARYGEIGVPVAVRFGTGDRILNHRTHGQRFATQVPQARLSLTDGGHMLPVTAPQATADWLRGFARRCLAEGRSAAVPS